MNQQFGSNEMIRDQKAADIQEALRQMLTSLNQPNPTPQDSDEPPAKQGRFEK